MRPTIFFVVGHENWGKSHTLRFLTDGDWRTRKVTINDLKFFIRRMSNDDQPSSYIEFMEKLSPEKHRLLIAALCPNFERANAKTENILASLKAKGYELYFWVMQKQYGTSEEVRQDEVSELRKYGSVELLRGDVEAKKRAAEFRSYIESKVIA